MNYSPKILTIHDLLHWGRYTHYNNACRAHKRIRDRIQPGKRTLTIREFAEYMGLSYEEVYEEIRGKYP